MFIIVDKKGRYWTGWSTDHVNGSRPMWTTVLAKAFMYGDKVLAFESCDPETERIFEVNLSLGKEAK